MRVRDHVVISTMGAAILYPRLRGGVLGSWAASILIDADHYVWFCLQQRRLSPRAAVRFFNQADAPGHRATRLLHSPLAVLAALLLGTRRRPAAYVGLGMAVHVAVDAGHRGRLQAARSKALRRDGYACRACGSTKPREAGAGSAPPQLEIGFSPRCS